ncbi:uncharacterized protein RCC_01012 [Ramularia collo-cygni]|uniref:Uncharacterized protein n=1 Tax=Ramularia collo-cygni TaxID=112498 RepID=A0A2D3UTG5_9PEZI|nr:uncharacterized protein RCC_01012 [Ramularia collo-cygni]CZT15117.1 uncharacterized protein RCC_01012 [Ramularia collo-cygni]
MQTVQARTNGFETLPCELRLQILEHVFADNLDHSVFNGHGMSTGLLLDDKYMAHHHLQPLLTCRQMYQDASLLAMSRTNFVVSNLFFRVPERLARLHVKQIEALRSIAFVADARHFRELIAWNGSPFGMPGLQLETLTIILHRSSFWHYLFDFTADVVKLLRNLKGIRKFVFVRNGARVKGSFKTWCNRLVGLIMKIDHQERYMKSVPCLEMTWWEWRFDDVAQSLCLEARAARPLVDEETYFQQMMPLMEALRVSVEDEEWNPDPRAHNGT